MKENQPKVPKGTNERKISSEDYKSTDLTELRNFKSYFKRTLKL